LLKNKNKITEKLMQIFDLMFEHTRPRHWWPAQTRFEVIVGAILTQFVSWKNVERAVSNLKENNLLSLEAIWKVETETLEKHIRCTRFYKQKARKLKEFCEYVCEYYDKDLERFLNRDKYELRKELLSLYGIGEETADSIILYAAEKPIFVVDSYTRRIFNRLGFFEENISYKDMQKFFMDNLPHDVKLFNEYHAQIDWVGNNCCAKTTPKCIDCPLGKICKSFSGH